MDLEAIAESAQAVDRISDLPDSLLSHILSFVSTKDAVSTSVLSKRWNRVWLSVFSLDFDDRSFFHQNFVSFVNHVLQFRGSQFIQNFRLKCSDFDLGFMPLQNWILTAIQHRVETLDLCFTYGCWNIVLPPSLLCCKTLVVLKLTAKTIKALPFDDVTVDLPSLRILHLYFVQFSDYKCVAKLLSGCKLEEFVLTFNMSGKISLGDNFESLPMLKKAKINSLIPLTVMQNLQCLHLDLFEDSSAIDVPTFHNLVDLELRLFGSQWHLVLRILQNTPKLQTLFLDKINNSFAFLESINVWPDVPAECLSSSLKTFHYREIIGSEYNPELQFIRYIMKNARVLRTLKICKSICCCNVQEMKKALSSCTPISENCQLIFECEI